ETEEKINDGIVELLDSSANQTLIMNYKEEREKIRLAKHDDFCYCCSPTKIKVKLS
ncbi:unnamed protein product, partial [Dovyalis caffra]